MFLNPGEDWWNFGLSSFDIHGALFVYVYISVLLLLFFKLGMSVSSNVK